MNFGCTLSRSNHAQELTLGSRFRTTPSGQDLDLETELMMVDRYRQQQLMDEFARLSPPSSWNNNLGFPSEYIEEYDTIHGSNRINPLHQSMNYSSRLPSSPLRMSSLHQSMNHGVIMFK
ncbi:hypothetical protein Hanom_Chr03g00230661 [Helianthus anomalus]